MEQLIAKIWSLIGLFTLLQNILPPHLHNILMDWLSSIKDYFSPPHYHMEIPEFKDSHGVNPNDLYEPVERYLNGLDGISRTRRLTVFRARNSTKLGFSPAFDEVVEDSFRGVRVWWTHSALLEQRNGGGGGGDRNAVNERRSFTLKVEQPDKDFLCAYFDRIANRAAELNTLNKDLMLYTNTGDARWGEGWTGVPFKHPSTFASLALNPLLKSSILRDLDRFKRGKEFYRRIGRSWKRGYLLHGPPGSGKSSLIAAIANHMRYDVYDLELTQVIDNIALRALLTQTKEESVIIIEDIDCSLNLADRASNPPPGDRQEEEGSSVTLSGLLNFTDGLWSCCGEERIIVFTTNHKEMLDPALLRSGRMDMHIFLSSCTFDAFKTLAFNYLQVEDHPLFPSVEEKMNSGAEMTCAEIIEVLMNKVEEPSEALNDVIWALDAKIKEKEEMFPVSSTSREDVEEESETSKIRKNSHRGRSGKRGGTRRGR
ncbi:hypothetical protein SUGI_0687640 [Cryptomeria japonica]|uniref:AAA-ATPase At4g30250-like n=1 Tax=Cryptomeria japonica TaxID=3369 RepID=UPI0024147AE0|nr:AAA-ATPase At4g30250-like [Cryptomeria japonica]GLJ34215.1 hypothetical protein SUGI_0687640 [Cryptomeria japonica]